MDMSKLGRGERMAAYAGIALFLIMIMSSWFGVDVPAEVRGLTGQDFNFNAFEVFEVIDLILFVTIVVAVGLAFAKSTGKKIRLPISASALTAGLGILSTFLIFYRILDVPGPGGGVGIERKLGVFLGLIAAAGIAYGGWISMKSEGVTFADAAEDIQEAAEDVRERFAPDDTDESTPTESG